MIIVTVVTTSTTKTMSTDTHIDVIHFIVAITIVTPAVDKV